MKHILLVLTALCATLQIAAQYGPNYNIPVQKGTVDYKFGWVGGLNNPQFSAADLNNDGIDDLVVFDRSGNRVYTFLNSGLPGIDSYSYAPQHEAFFPAMNSWCLLVDFNCDNVPDIFTNTTLGIRVFKGYYDECNRLAFNLYLPLLKFDFLGTPVNLLVTAVDIPAIVDVNNDGDIDVLTFDPNGGYMWYFENVSQQMGWGCDSLYFQRVDQCWGDFYEPSTTNCMALDIVCPFIPPHNGDNGTRGSGGFRHTGSTTLAWDNTGDGVKELLIGDISFKEVNYLMNNGTLNDAHIYDQDCTFPSYSVPVTVPYFPASFRLDVDNDGVKDLLFAPNAEEGSNTLACAHWYRNTGTNANGVFNFQTDSFLVSDMIDFGEGSAPVFFDYDGDGLLDLLVSNASYYDTSSFVATFRNIGTATNPAFRLTKKNYANLAALNKLALRPTFGDLDGDGDPDMICGTEDGTLLYFTNSAAPGNPPQFILTNPNYFGIDVGHYSAPQLYDVNGDGLLDLIIGRLNGKISYYENHGTAANPDFSTVTSTSFGGVNVNATALDGHSYPFMTTLPGFNGPVLLVGNKQGNIELYDSIAGNTMGTFNLVTNQYNGIRMGKRSTIAAADLNGDGVVELALGSYRGGVTIYDTASYASANPCTGIYSVTRRGMALNAYPNPVQQVVFLKSASALPPNALVETFDALGRLVTTTAARIDANTVRLAVEELPNGVYTSRIVSDRLVQVARWVKTD